LQKGQVLSVEPPPGDRPSLKRKALNSMINDYLRSAGYEYSQSVFSEESLAGAMPSLTDDELLDVLHISKTSTLYHAVMTARATATSAQGACFLLSLIEAIAEVAYGGRGSEAGTQTGGSDRYHLEVRVSA
jgi:oral-facial-digital syndrome 1 protein